MVDIRERENEQGHRVDISKGSTYDMWVMLCIHAIRYFPSYVYILLGKYQLPDLNQGQSCSLLRP